MSITPGNICFSRCVKNKYNDLQYIHDLISLNNIKITKKVKEIHNHNFKYHLPVKGLSICPLSYS